MRLLVSSKLTYSQDPLTRLSRCIIEINRIEYEVRREYQKYLNILDKQKLINIYIKQSYWGKEKVDPYLSCCQEKGSAALVSLFVIYLKSACLANCLMLDYRIAWSIGFKLYNESKLFLKTKQSQQRQILYYQQYIRILTQNIQILLIFPVCCCWPSQMNVSPVRIDQKCASNARVNFLSTVAQFTYLSMIGPSQTIETDHLDDIYNIYSVCESPQHQDLYELLLHQPNISKKPSILYDYTPSNVMVLSAEPEGHDLLIEPYKVGQQSSQTQIAIRKCTCSKTKCQKNYCECFKQGVVCSSACQCISCCNKEKLFSAKFSSNEGKCKCQKSRCQKNYCECHLNGRKCGSSCRCVDCENKDLPQDCLQLSNQVPTKKRKTNDSH